LLLVAFLLTACGGAAAPASQASAPKASGGAEGWQATWDQTLAAAKKEGTVTVAGPPQEAERSVLLTFLFSYPDIKLEYTGITDQEFLARATAERSAGTYAWDLIIGGVSERYPYAAKGFWQPIKDNLILPEVTDDNKWLGGFDAGYFDNDKKYVYSFISSITDNVRANRTAVPESQLPTVEGLTDPRWKGKIVVYDPRAGGGGLVAVTSLRKQLGDEALKTILVDQQPVFSTDKRQFTEWVVRARNPIGIGVSDGYLAPFREQGLGGDVKRIPGKIHVIGAESGGVSVMDRTPHPNAAKIFLNWLLSRETQAAWAKRAATNSRRLDVESGNLDNKPDQTHLSDYVDFNSERNNAFMRDTQKLAQTIIP